MPNAVKVITDEDGKKVVEYQPEDEWGNPIGRLQRFEGKTWKDVTEQTAAAHLNSSAELFRTKRNVKFGRLLEDVDPEEPVATYDERLLTADERMKLAKGINTPESIVETFDTLLEARLGVPRTKVRQTAQVTDAQARSEKVTENIYQFRQAHPEYVESETNRDAMIGYLQKHKMGITKKNLEIAFEDLKNDGLIVLRVPNNRPTEPQAPATPPPVPAIPAQATPAAPISETPAVTPAPTAPKTTPSSSGLSSRGADAPQTPQAPKVTEITWAEVNSLTAAQYAERLRTDRVFAAAVDKLLAGKK